MVVVVLRHHGKNKRSGFSKPVCHAFTSPVWCLLSLSLHLGLSGRSTVIYHVRSAICLPCLDCNIKENEHLTNSLPWGKKDTIPPSHQMSIVQNSWLNIYLQEPVIHPRWDQQYNVYDLEKGKWPKIYAPTLCVVHNSIITYKVEGTGFTRFSI